MKDAYSREEISIPLENGESFDIIAESSIETNSLLEITQETAHINGEEPYQLLEGYAYEYELPIGYELKSIPGIVHPSRRSKTRGRITPNIYVGRLPLTVFHAENDKVIKLAVEIRSIKAEYRSEYRKMLEDITAECTELLLLHSSPVTQNFTVDYEGNSETLYQRFAFVKSIVDSDDFRNAVNRIITMPVTAWSHRLERSDIRRSRRIGSNQIRQIASQSARINLPLLHPLRSKINSIPSHLNAKVKTETADNPENRFVKHALKEFERFCGFICQHIENKQTNPLKRPHIYNEAKTLESRFSEYLNHSLFREVQEVNSLPLNSPVLQRKSGYREVLRVWLMYDLAAKLIWKALDDESYHAGKRDVATLYEYWLFFKLLRLIEGIFDIDPRETKSLIKETSDGLGLQLLSGRHTAVEGVYKHKARELRIKFSYNRTFNNTDFPNSGSWTQRMRPDYTLTIWPKAFTEREAEEQELIVHVHFDAKYRVDGLEYLISNNESELSEEELNNEKEMQKQGKYKRADLLKMHAYKDAIRRTVGAYVLYPGSKTYERRGYHEIIPGLGAFPVSPSDNGDGLESVDEFIHNVVDHFCNRASQRESISYHDYKIHGESDPEVREKHALYGSLPEEISGHRLRPPQKDMTVLIGYYNEKQYEWIGKTGLYNIRIDKKNGLEKYSESEMNAEYLLLRGKGQQKTGDLWKITGETPVLMSKQELIDKKYPTTPSQEYYLVFKVTPTENEKIWDVRKIPGHKKGRASARPFSVYYSDMKQAFVK